MLLAVLLERQVASERVRQVGRTVLDAAAELERDVSGAVSVEAQAADANSVLSVYRKFGKAREEYAALAEGSLGYCAEASGASSVSAWFRIVEGQKILVVHNFGGGNVNINFSSSKLDDMILSNGTVTVNGNKLTLGAYSSAVFMQ